MNTDLRRASYDEFIKFVFDHYPEDDVDNRWYWKLEDRVQIDPRRAIEYLTRMCTNAAELLESYTLPQIGHGINYLFGAGGGATFGEQVWNPQVPWPERYRCILAIPCLYTQVFETDPDGAGGLAYMLWDSIAYGYGSGSRHPLTDAEDARVQDAMFEALTSMLNSDHRETLAGAIHGLGHLSHRESNRAIRDLLSSGRPLDPELRQYAAAVLEGDFQ